MKPEKRRGAPVGNRNAAKGERVKLTVHVTPHTRAVLGERPGAMLDRMCAGMPPQAEQVRTGVDLLAGIDTDELLKELLKMK